MFVRLGFHFESLFFVFFCMRHTLIFERRPMQIPIFSSRLRPSALPPIKAFCNTTEAKPELDPTAGARICKHVSKHIAISKSVFEA